MLSDRIPAGAKPVGYGTVAGQEKLEVTQAAATVVLGEAWSIASHFATALGCRVRGTALIVQVLVDFQAIQRRQPGTCGLVSDAYMMVVAASGKHQDHWQGKATWKVEQCLLDGSGSPIDGWYISRLYASDGVHFIDKGNQIFGELEARA